MDGLGELVKVVSALWAWATTTTGVPTALVAVAVFFIGLQQYRTKLRWDRQELVAKEVKELEERPSARAALKMIDYSRHGRPLDLSFAGGEPMKEFRVDSITLGEALMPYRDGDHFDDKQIVIRDCFDDLLAGWARLNRLLDAGFVKPDELRPYLSSWIQHQWFMPPPEPVRSRVVPHRAEDWHLALWQYADEYYPAVRPLMERLAALPGRKGPLANARTWVSGRAQGVARRYPWCQHTLRCRQCGYTVRISPKWLDVGLPCCPEGDRLEREP